MILFGQFFNNNFFYLYMKVASNNLNLERVADIGGHKILGTSGSLMNYIYTGKAFAKNGKLDADSFCSTKDNHKKVFKTALKITGIIGALAGAVLLIKHGFKNGFKFKKLDPVNRKI